MRVRAVPLVAAVILGLVAMTPAPTAAIGADSTGSAIFARALAASEDAASLTLKANLINASTSYVLDISVSKSGNGVGSIRHDGETIDLVRIGQTVYFKATPTFWTKIASARAAALFAGKWVSGPATSSTLKHVGGYFDVRSFLNQLFGKTGNRNLTERGTTTFMGRRVAILRSHNAAGGSTIYVGSHAPYYLYRIAKRGGSSHGSVTLFNYNKPVRPVKPRVSITLAKLASGSPKG
jgi:hypothetical protein